MMQTLIQPVLSRFSPIQPELVVQAYLSGAKKEYSLPQLQNGLKALLSADAVDKAAATLIELGKASLERNKVLLTPAGKASALQVPKANEEWETIRSRILPLIALGVNLNDTAACQKLAKSDALVAAAITVAFGLPKEIMASINAVRSEIIWRVLREALPKVIGKGPFPSILKPGVVERTLLAGVAGVNANSILEATNALAAYAIGAEKNGVDALRRRLVQIGIHLADRPKVQAQPSATEVLNGTGNFATKVHGIASKLSTPPFQGRVAIAQVYDAYGKVYPDAGALKRFKERLVDAARSREIQLGRLELPERMGNDLRERSETRWDQDSVHFVIIDWK